MSVPRLRQLASDNVSGVCPEVFSALLEANRGHVTSYGDDPFTARAQELVRDFLGVDCEVFFVFTGTAANALSLAALSPPYGVVACHEAAHILTDECGASGLFGHGLRLYPMAGPNGKLPEEALARFAAFTDVHSGRPAAVSLTQCTELGTVYTLDELRALRTASAGLNRHMDGARFGNALAALNASPRDVIKAAGLHALTLGGTKNGLMGAEAVVFFDPERARDFGYRRKQAGQLSSKHRFLAAQWIGILESEAYLRNARHANAMAARLAEMVAGLGFPPVRPCEANEVFLPLPAGIRERLLEQGWVIYEDAHWQGARLVASWDTDEADLDAFRRDLAAAAAGSREMARAKTPEGAFA